MNHIVIPLNILDPCKQLVCEFYSKCNRKADDTAECVCPLCNDDNYALVCGSTGKFYASQCDLQKAACNQMINIKAVGKEACGKSYDITLH